MDNKTRSVCQLSLLFLIFAVVLFVFVQSNSSVVAAPPGCSEKTKTYTFNDDFDEGLLNGVENTSVPDQLQIGIDFRTLPFIWVPNWGQGTVSKINTETGDELARYEVSGFVPSFIFNDPSRTTVDAFGSCWVGNRRRGTVVKIGLFENGQFIDRNGNGTIETSRDLNGDGDIDSSTEMLPWGQDECVLWEVSLINGSEGPYVPGTFPGTYDEDYWGTAPRGLAIDANNNLWAGTYDSRLYYIDGTTGAILRGPIDVSPHTNYGAVIDENGILWSASGPQHTTAPPGINKVLRFDPTTETFTTLDLGHWVYGLGLDYDGHLFVSSYGYGKLTKIDVNTGMGSIVWTKDRPELLYADARGVACTADNNVWVASTANDRVYRYDNDGNLITAIDVALLGGTGNPTGVSVDAAGKVWACNYIEPDSDPYITDDHVHRIDPATNTVDLSKEVIGSYGHYTYSDMTGIVLRTITTTIGTWDVTYDSGIPNTPWEMVSWNSNQPAGTSIEVYVRSSHNKIAWSGWEAVGNGVPFGSPPDGRYLQVQVIFRILSGDVSPVLYDLTITRKDPIITATADSGGYISPSGLVVVSCGSGQTFYIIPYSCYNIKEVFVDGFVTGAVSIDPVTGIGTYVFANVTDNHTIHATFEPYCSEFSQCLLGEGWNLYSFSVNKCFYVGTSPDDQPECVEMVDVINDLGFASLADWFESIITSINPMDKPWSLIIGTEGVMDSSLPPSSHSLKYMSVCSGYWVKIKDGSGGASIAIDGALFDPDCAIPMVTGWSIASYPLDIGFYDTDDPPVGTGVTTWVKVPRPVGAYVFASIAGKYWLIISTHGVYDPSLSPTSSSLRYIAPCDAVWVKMTEPWDLVYSAMGTATAPFALSAPSMTHSAMRRGVNPTSSLAVVYGNVTENGVEANEGTHVQVYSDSGVLCGESVVSHKGSYEMMVVYGDDALTPQIDGAQHGEKLTFHVDGIPAKTEGDVRWLGNMATQVVDIASYSLPDESVLGQSDPSSSNSETWIPYKLQAGSIVEVRIYTKAGQLVRTMNLGYKPAGSYTEKHKAAYWDGRNEAGEYVENGTYLYSIKKGDLQITGKLVIEK